MGWNGSSAATSAATNKKIAKPRKASSGAPMSGAFKGTLALILVLAIGAGAYWFTASDEVKSKVIEKLPKRQIAEVAPDIAEPVEVEESVVVVEPKKAAPPKPRGPNLRDPKLSEEKRLELYEKTLQEKEIPPESTNRVFRTGLEQVMSWVFTTEVGDMPPPLPPMSDYDFVHLKEILELENPVRETDSEQAAYAKETVDFAKKEFKAFLEKGGEPEDFLEYYHSELQEAYAIRKQAQDSVNKIIAEAPELTGDYIKKVNDSLAEKGIKGVVVPVRTLLKMGLHPEDVGCEMPNK